MCSAIIEAVEPRVEAIEAIVALLLAKEKELRVEEENLITELRRVRDEKKKLLDAVLEVRGRDDG